MRPTSMQQEIEDLVARGWTIEDADRDRVVMVDREFGSVGSHLVVALLTIWWTMGVGNVLWAAYNYVSNTRRRILWEGASGTDATRCPNCGTEVTADDAYCPSCGHDVETYADRDAESGAEIVCPDCDAVAASGDRYCRACGTKLADAMETGS